MEIPGQGCGTGNGQDPELSEHFPERWGARCALGQEMASPGRDVGTSFLINFLGGPLPGQRSRAEMGPDPAGGRFGRRAAAGCPWLVLESISVVGNAPAQLVRSLQAL